MLPTWPPPQCDEFMAAQELSLRQCESHCPIFSWGVLPRSWLFNEDSVNERMNKFLLDGNVIKSPV